jgi:hypothetical protein
MTFLLMYFGEKNYTKKLQAFKEQS